MTARLREELSALAETHPFSPDPSAWDRGRRARRRDHALRGAAVLAVVALVVGLGTLLAPDREARTASTDVVEGGAIPSRIVDIDGGLEATTDLAVGRASAAFISASQDDPVVITAMDGVPHRLALPGWGTGNQGLSLSPDGTRLAWHDQDSGQATIAVLELMTGGITRHQVHPDGDLALRELSWSPDSVWLAWLGDTEGGAYVGRLRPVFAVLDDNWFVRGNVPGVAVRSDAGLVFSRASGGLFSFDDRGRPAQLSDADQVGAGAFSPDGAMLALRTSPGTASRTFRWAGRTIVEHPFPDATFDRGAVIPLGWLDVRHQLLQVWSDEDSPAELVVATPEVGETSTWRRSVGSIDASIAGRVSLAVDLVPDLDGTSWQQLTHDFGERTEDERDFSWIIGLGVAAAIAVLLGLRRLWRRLRP
ncbi:hypothetical protein [Nocardioides sp. SYSU D00065]|uniref:hypothetical protein n=1 Tax=Nocardioides sp. SYSU D00065 TaxID=2817378 RepID=UPI001B32679E|nr:hypothetical protein [Nocardioides sp. SYSU D00065]